MRDIDDSSRSATIRDHAREPKVRAWRMRASSLALTAVLSLGPGCALFLPSGPSTAQVQDAYAAGDQESLERWCEQSRSMDRNSASSDGARTACVRARALEQAQQRTASLQTFLAAVTCENASASFVAFAAASPRPAEAAIAEAFTAAGSQLASCDLYDELLGGLLPRAGPLMAESSTPTRRYGYRLLNSLAEEGVDIEARVVAFSAGNTYDFEGGRFVADAVVTFLLERRLTQDGCEPYVSASTSGSVRVLESFMEYYARSRCREAGRSLAALLTHDSSRLRASVCTTLGRIGDPAHRGMMTRVARRDGESVAIRGAVVYPVRDACSSALLRLAAR